VKNDLENQSITSFIIQFIFGGLLGAAIGLGLFIKGPFRSSVSIIPLLIHVLGGAVLVGAIAGFEGDAFWDKLSERYINYNWMRRWFFLITVIVAIFIVWFVTR
jgi:hypothetical protein